MTETNALGYPVLQPKTPVPSDIDVSKHIVNDVGLLPMKDLAKQVELADDEVIPWGIAKAKVDLKARDRRKDQPDGNYVVGTLLLLTTRRVSETKMNHGPCLRAHLFIRNSFSLSHSPGSLMQLPESTRRPLAKENLRRPSDSRRRLEPFSTRRRSLVSDNLVKGLPLVSREELREVVTLRLFPWKR